MIFILFKMISNIDDTFSIKFYSNKISFMFAVRRNIELQKKKKNFFVVANNPFN